MKKLLLYVVLLLPTSAMPAAKPALKATLKPADTAVLIADQQAVIKAQQKILGRMNARLVETQAQLTQRDQAFTEKYKDKFARKLETSRTGDARHVNPYPKGKREQQIQEQLLREQYAQRVPSPLPGEKSPAQKPRRLQVNQPLSPLAPAASPLSIQVPPTPTAATPKHLQVPTATAQ